MVSMTAPGRRQHGVDLVADAVRDLVRPGLEHQIRHVIGDFPMPRKRASDPRTIRNGNSAIRAESAMWLAVAQPSSALKR